MFPFLPCPAHSSPLLSPSFPSTALSKLVTELCCTLSDDANTRPDMGPLLAQDTPVDSRENVQAARSADKEARACCLRRGAVDEGKLDASRRELGRRVGLLLFSQPLFGSFSVLSNCCRAAVIDGKAIAENVRQCIAVEVAKMKATFGEVPGLAVVLVGARKDSLAYVYNKKIACAEVGIASYCAELPEDTSEEEVLNIVKSFNDDSNIHGVLVQLPLPQHIEEERILSAVSLNKDVDGFHPLNIGNLALQGREPLFVPCTAKACLELLLGRGILLTGRHAVVIGCSNIVGLPVSLLLQRHNATVTVVHALTENPAEYTRRADIVISAAGSANLVRGHWLKPGAVVLDVGINHVQVPTLEGEVQLVGDVCFEEACKVASAISPVPGGVGPMTIAMLLCNTLKAAKLAYGLTGI